jgi:threonylcarbamoyladenosine tRNA methylthiotransferase MtaB
MPDAAIGADVMVGFPGETDDDFEQTRSFIQRLPFTYLHVFTYSSRPGTPSAEMAEQVPVRIARERNRVLRELAMLKKREFMESFVGREVEAITLTHYDGEFTEALTDNYLKLRIAGSHNANSRVAADIASVSEDALIGTDCSQMRSQSG